MPFREAVTTAVVCFVWAHRRQYLAVRVGSRIFGHEEIGAISCSLYLFSFFHGCAGFDVVLAVGLPPAHTVPVPPTVTGVGVRPLGALLCC